MRDWFRDWTVANYIVAGVILLILLFVAWAAVFH